MSLDSLGIEDFRCIEKADLALHGRCNLISGENASGKTSLLEAIFVLGRGRSFRTARAEALIRGGRRAPVSFTCLVPENFSILERVALLVQQQLAEIDVRMKLESLPPDEFNQRIVSGRFDAAILSILGGPSAAGFYRFWHSAGDTRRWNFWGYRTALVDAALDAARDAASDAEFSDAIRRFEAAVRDDPPAVFLAWSQTVQAVSHRFAVPGDQDGRDALYVLHRWQLRRPGGGAP